MIVDLQAAQAKLLELAQRRPTKAEAKALRELIREPRRLRVARSQRGAAVARKARRLTKNEETARIREEVFGRSGGVCELCVEPRYPATELAHLEGGIGRRRERQTYMNTAASCRFCNDEWDDHPERRLEMATRWNGRANYPIPPGILAAAALKGWTVPESRASTRTDAPEREVDRG